MIELVMNPATRDAYLEWKNNPVTQRIHAMARKTCSPRILEPGPDGKMDAVLATYQLALYTGYDLLLRTMFEADEVATDPAFLAKMKELQPTYGAAQESRESAQKG